MFWRKVTLLLLNSHCSFFTFINIYTRPTFVPSLKTIGSKLRPLECFKGFSLDESPTSPIGATQLIYELNLYLNITYIYFRFGDNRIKITPSIVNFRAALKAPKTYLKKPIFVIFYKKSFNCIFLFLFSSNAPFLPVLEGFYLKKKCT